MSRIGQNPINIPAGVKIDFQDSLVKVEGQKGSIENQVHRDMNISQSDGTVLVKRNSDAREQRAIHGTTRQMIHNMVVGVSEGVSKELEIIGVGYQAQVD